MIKATHQFNVRLDKPTMRRILAFKKKHNLTQAEVIERAMKALAELLKLHPKHALGAKVPGRGK